MSGDVGYWIGDDGCHHTAPTPPQSEEAETEVEALAALLLTHQEAWPTHCTCGWKMSIKADAADENGVSVTVQHAHHVAQVVLASDWLAAGGGL